MDFSVRSSTIPPFGIGRKMGLFSFRRRLFGDASFPTRVRVCALFLAVVANGGVMLVNVWAWPRCGEELTIMLLICVGAWTCSTVVQFALSDRRDARIITRMRFCTWSLLGGCLNLTLFPTFSVLANLAKVELALSVSTARRHVLTVVMAFSRLATAFEKGFLRMSSEISRATRTISQLMSTTLGAQKVDEIHDLNKITILHHIQLTLRLPLGHTMYSPHLYETRRGRSSTEFLC